MTKTILILGVAAAGLFFIFMLFKLLKKGAKFAKYIPKNHLIFLVVYAILGLTGFLLTDQITEYPLLLGSLLFLVSLTAGILITNNLYEKWEWGMAASFGKKLLFLFSLALTGMVSFGLVFLLCEHRGWPRQSLSSDMMWWLAAIASAVLLPLFVQLTHTYWNRIPMISQLKHIFRLPVGEAPPFIEGGGENITFEMIIPYQYHSKDIVKSKVAAPLQISLEEILHFKIHEHNIIKRRPQKIFIAENNKKSKIYGWCFYRIKPIWWGLWQRKHYLNPRVRVVTNVSRGDTIFVERVKVWEQEQEQ